MWYSGIQLLDQSSAKSSHLRIRIQLLDQHQLIEVMPLKAYETIQCFIIKPMDKRITMPLKELIVVGGGCTLLRLASKVDAIKNSLENDEEKVGANIDKRPLGSWATP